MQPTNEARRVRTNALVKVVPCCKIFLVDALARARIALSWFRGLSDWLAGNPIKKNKREYLVLQMHFIRSVVQRLYDVFLAISLEQESNNVRVRFNDLHT